MGKLPRVTAKIFASNADANDIGQYGSALAGTKVLTSDIARIQALPAYETGWRGAVVSTRNYPTLQEMNGLQKTFSQQIAYTLQSGVPEWDNTTDYYINNFSSYDGVIYKSISDNNVGNRPDISPANWEVYGANDDYANQDLTNLTNLGNARLMYKPFTIDIGPVLNGENNTLTYSGSTLTCAPCTITTCDGRVLQDTETRTFNVSTIPSSETTWEQPIITSDGTMGGDSFACAASSEYTAEYGAWRCFDGVTSTMYYRSSGVLPQWIGWYNPNPLKVTNIAFKNNTAQASQSPTSGSVQGSNDNSTWTTITNFTNSETAAGATWNIDLSGNTNFYNYYRLNIDTNYSPNTVAICHELTLTATQSSRNGGYVFKSYSDGSLSISGNLLISRVEPTNPSSDLMWLDISTVPATLKSYSGGSWIDKSDLVLIGECSASNGVVTGVKNRYFNACPYMRDLVDSFHSGYSSCDIYSDGYCEQGGFVGGIGTEYEIVLLKRYLDSNYNITTGLGFQNKDTYLEASNIYYGGKTNSSFKLYLYGSAYYSYWKTTGYVF